MGAAHAILGYSRRFGNVMVLTTLVGAGNMVQPPHGTSEKNLERKWQIGTKASVVIAGIVGAGTAYVVAPLWILLVALTVDVWGDSGMIYVMALPPVFVGGLLAGVILGLLASLESRNSIVAGVVAWSVLILACPFLFGEWPWFLATRGGAVIACLCASIAGALVGTAIYGASTREDW